MPTVGKNGFPSYEFTDCLATLTIAPQGEKALRRGMMQGVQSRGNTAVGREELTNLQVFRLSLGEGEGHKWKKTSHPLNSERRLGLKQANQQPAKYKLRFGQFCSLSMQHAKELT